MVGLVVGPGVEIIQPGPDLFGAGPMVRSLMKEGKSTEAGAGPSHCVEFRLLIQYEKA